MPELQDRFPRQTRIGDVALDLSLMGPADRDEMIRFAGSLDAHDLLFLRRDIKRPEVIDDWLSEIEDGEIYTILARSGGAIVGYATLHLSKLEWSRHVAEIRVLVAADVRGKGVGGFLTQEVFTLALALDVEKIVARMTLDQRGAMKTFEGLGFRPEALMRDHVKDAAGKTHDLVVMSHSVADFHRTLEAYGVTESLGAC